MEKSFVVIEDAHYIILYKPEKMHCAPLKKSEDGTLLDFCGSLFPEILSLQGKRNFEGGLIHRLDFETQGLVLFARSQKSLNHFQKAQDNGLFLKRYIAQVSKIPASKMQGSKTHASFLGFPLPPEHGDVPDDTSFEITSAFRPFGPGRKAVRPVLMDNLPKHKDIAFDQNGPYITKVIDWQQKDNNTAQVEIELRRGFRHQIRSHLAWIGFPILNDLLYGGEKTLDEKLALKAVSLSFPDPETNEIIKIDL